MTTRSNEPSDRDDTPYDHLRRLDRLSDQQEHTLQIVTTLTQTVVKVTETLERISGETRSLLESTNRMIHIVEELDRTVRVDQAGVPSILSRVRDLEGVMEEIKKQRDSQNAKMWGLFLAVIGALAMGAVDITLHHFGH